MITPSVDVNFKKREEVKILKLKIPMIFSYILGENIVDILILRKALAEAENNQN